MSPLERHSIAETFNPSSDHEQWMAFIVLNHLYPSLTYLSWDGYNCHGLADHSLGVIWQGQTVKNTKTNSQVFTVPEFTTLNKTDIVHVWTQAIRKVTRLA